VTAFHRRSRLCCEAALCRTATQ